MLMSKKEINTWVSANTLATAVIAKRNGAILDDTYWLQLMNDTQHINVVQIDAALKGYNLALQWQAKVIHVKIDPSCAYH